MQLKSWILDKLNRMDSLFGRPDLPQRNAAAVGAQPSGSTGMTAPQLVVEHLGPYGPLIEAIRDALQQFVDGQLRLHLAIAERDRFLLSSIDISCSEDGEAQELLRRFVAEFKPDQIRRFLRREVISGLPNAGAIELSQFAGLRIVTPPSAEPAEGGDEYAELLAELREAGPTADPSAYSMTLGGRWVERDSEAPDSQTRSGQFYGSAPVSPQTPLAGHRLDVDIEDANGFRRISLAAVVSGRRYSVGKGEGCDIVVDGTYTSRRHAEFWFDGDSWWIADTGSTNGIRVEVESNVVARSSPAQPDGAHERPIELPAGARIVLSALAEGPSSDYPALGLRPGSTAVPLAAVAGAPTTPITPIVAPRRSSQALLLTAKTASGERSVVIDAQAMPFGIGRSRSQALAIDLAHPSVSGHHLEITGCDEFGADVVVKGDNGVVVDGTSYPAGARFRWQPGATMVLGRAMPNEPVCTLHLARRP